MNDLAGFPPIDWTATFEDDCIVAIEDYIHAQHLHDPESLVHRSVRLDTIVSRHLYILLISSRDVQMHYATAKAGLDCGLPLPDPHVRAIMERMTGRTIGVGDPVPPPLSRFAPAWRLARWLRHVCRPAAARHGAGRPLLLMTHQIKFVRYFRPLLDAMPGTGAFLLPDRRTQRALGICDAESLPQPLATPRAITSAVRRWRTLCVLVDEIECALRHYAPRCVLVAEGDAPYHEALALLGRKLSIPVFCLQWGAFPYRAPHLGFRNMSHHAFLSWGDGFVEQLRPFNPGLCFLSVGSHVLAAAEVAPERRILFLMQGADNYTILPDHWQQFMDFTAWTVQSNPDWQIVIRAHPNLPLSVDEIARLCVFPNVVFQDAVQVPMGRALGGAAIAVSLVSSAILEALAQGVFPFLFNPTTMVPHFQPDLQALGAGIEAKTLDQAKAGMARLLDDPFCRQAYGPALAEVGRHFFAAKGPIARDNIVSILRKAMAGAI